MTYHLVVTFILLLVPYLEGREGKQQPLYSQLPIELIRKLFYFVRGGPIYRQCYGFFNVRKFGWKIHIDERISLCFTPVLPYCNNFCPGCDYYHHYKIAEAHIHYQRVLNRRSYSVYSPVMDTSREVLPFKTDKKTKRKPRGNWRERNSKWCCFQEEGYRVEIKEKHYGGGRRNERRKKNNRRFERYLPETEHLRLVLEDEIYQFPTKKEKKYINNLGGPTGWEQESGDDGGYADDYW
jgi:hypothetical protein